MEFFAHWNFFLDSAVRSKTTLIIIKFKLTIIDLSLFQTGEFDVSLGENISMSSFTLYLHNFMLQKSDALIYLAS